MTEQQKLKQLETIQELRTRIGACFGDQDNIFAGHTLDEKMAVEFRKMALENFISLFEIQDMILGFLFRKGCSFEHIKKQTDKATNFFSKKLQ